MTILGQREYNDETSLFAKIMYTDEILKTDLEKIDSDRFGAIISEFLFFLANNFEANKIIIDRYPEILNRLCGCIDIYDKLKKENV